MPARLLATNRADRRRCFCRDNLSVLNAVKPPFRLTFSHQAPNEDAMNQKQQKYNKESTRGLTLELQMLDEKTPHNVASRRLRATTVSKCGAIHSIGSTIREVLSQSSCGVAYTLDFSVDGNRSACSCPSEVTRVRDQCKHFASLNRNTSAAKGKAPRARRVGIHRSSVR